MQQQTTSIKLNNENTIIGGQVPLSFGEGLGVRSQRTLPKTRNYHHKIK